MPGGKFQVKIEKPVRLKSEFFGFLFLICLLRTMIVNVKPQGLSAGSLSPQYPQSCKVRREASVKYCQLSLFGIILASLDFKTIKVGMVSTTPLGALLLVSLVSVASAQEQIFR